MKRRAPIRILLPKIQSSMFVTILCVIGVSALIQVLVSVRSLAAIARNLPNDGPVLDEMIVDVLLKDFAITLAIAVPALGFLSMIGMMKVVGPLYRMRRFLQEVVEGKETRPIRLREKDDFQDWCPLLNQVTEELRSRPGQGEEEHRIAS